MPILLLCLAALTAEDAWKDFSAWFLAEATPAAPAEVLKAYKAKLKAGGMDEAAVAERARTVQEYAAAHPREGLALHFDRMFTWQSAPFSREPSTFLIRVASTRKPGRALDIAMGQGRNALWLARNGWTVSGYDISNEALRQARAAASAANLILETRLASHDEYELGQERWDLIVMSFAFTNSATRRTWRKCATL